MKKISTLIILILISIFITACGDGKAPTTPDIPKNLPVIVSFTANPSEIYYSRTSTLFWQVNNATKCEITPDIGEVPFSGEKIVQPSQTITYQLKATNSDGSVTKNCTITVKASAWFELDGDVTISPAWDGDAVFTGWLKNTGNMIGYGISIDITVFKDKEKTIILGTGWDYHSGDVSPGQKFKFEARVWDVHWLNVHLGNYPYEIKLEWYNR